jgi:carboxyl-terminal processing protease
MVSIFMAMLSTIYYMKFLLLICFIVFSISVAAQDKPKDYLLEAINIMKENSVNKAKVDWNFLTRQAMDSLSNKHSIREAHSIVKQIIRKLGDSHSQFVPKEAVRAYMKTYQEQGMSFPYSKDSLIRNKMAYITIPSIGNLNIDDWNRYVNDFYKKVRKLEASHPKAWLIDVRDNDGGMFLPMFKVIQPFLDAKNVIGSEDNGGNITYYNITGNNITFGQRSIGYIAVPEIKLKNKNTPVYILTSKKTASSGEFIAACFVGQRNATIVGTNTQGLTSDNSDFKLSDGSIIILTTGTLIDRSGKAYTEVGKGITPDKKIKGKELNDYIQAL